VVKVGGAALTNESWIESFAAAAASSATPLLIVHGGGPDINALSDRLGIAVEWRDGRRITSPEVLDVVSMVLNGRINKRLVASLLAAGVDAIGISGVDGSVLRALQLEDGSLGRVGKMASVRTDLLEALLARGHTVVLSPLSLGEDGGALNVNADDVAAAVAAALCATELVFLTDVPGVRDGVSVRTKLDAGEAAMLVRTGVASGGMGVKLNAGVKALDSGVPSVRIGDASVLFDATAGTVLRPISLGAA
jgi:acetylglutamate kinase